MPSPAGQPAPTAAARLRGLVPYLIAVIGSSILAFGLYNVHARCAITEGGVLGATLLLHHWFDISPAVSGLVLDLTCFAVGLRFLGRDFARFSIVASLAFSAVYRFIERRPPVLPDLSGTPLLAALVGGLLIGVGVGIVVRMGGACGGDDALAMTINKLTGMDISRAYMITDFIVLGLSLSYIEPRRILYSLVTVTVSSLVISAIQKLTRPPVTKE